MLLNPTQDIRLKSCADSPSKGLFLATILLLKSCDNTALGYDNHFLLLTKNQDLNMEKDFFMRVQATLKKEIVSRDAGRLALYPRQQNKFF